MFEERAIFVIVPFIIGRIAENINYGTVSPNSTFQNKISLKIQPRSLLSILP
jgi:hypothetical protein